MPVGIPPSTLLGTPNVQPDASCLLEFLEHYILGAKAITILMKKRIDFSGKIPLKFINHLGGVDDEP
jgi:hypothetical protein